MFKTCGIFRLQRSDVIMICVFSPSNQDLFVLVFLHLVLFFFKTFVTVDSEWWSTLVTVRPTLLLFFFKIKTWTVFCGGKKNIRRICKFYFRMTVFQACFWLNIKINKIVYRGRRYLIHCITKQKLDTEDKDKQVPVLNSGMWLFFIRNIFLLNIRFIM